MEKIIEMLDYQFFSIISVSCSILFLVYVTYSISMFKKRYVPNLPMFILAVIMTVCYFFQCLIKPTFLNGFVFGIWILQSLYWYKLYKNQVVNRTIHKFIFKNESV